MGSKGFENIICRLKGLGTGNISDAMDSLGLNRGVIVGVKPLSYETPKLAGRAYTLRHIKKHSTRTFDQNCVRHAEVIDSGAQPGDVIVIDAGGRKDVAVWGDLNTMRAKYRGLAGVLVWGCVRDAKDIIEQSFPVYSVGSNPIKSKHDLETVGINAPVEVSGVHICPGDFIVGDETGIIVIPESQIVAVIEKAEEIIEKEKDWKPRLLQGIPFGDLSK